MQKDLWTQYLWTAGPSFKCNYFYRMYTRRYRCHCKVKNHISKWETLGRSQNAEYVLRIHNMSFSILGIFWQIKKTFSLNPGEPPTIKVGLMVWFSSNFLCTAGLITPGVLFHFWDCKGHTQPPIPSVGLRMDILINPWTSECLSYKRIKTSLLVLTENNKWLLFFFT